MCNRNPRINRTCQAFQTGIVALITAISSFFFAVIFLGLPNYYHHLSSRTVVLAYRQEAQYFSRKTHTASWKAVRNLSAVTSGFLTAILFKMPNDSSPESLRWLLIYPSLVLTSLALITSSMFIAHYEGEAHHNNIEVIVRPSFARSIVFALPAIMLVWGICLTMTWVAYTTLSTVSQFTNVVRMDIMHYASIFVLVTSISVAFGTLLAVVCTLRRYS